MNNARHTPDHPITAQDSHSICTPKERLVYPRHCDRDRVIPQDGQPAAAPAETALDHATPPLPRSDDDADEFLARVAIALSSTVIDYYSPRVAVECAYDFAHMMLEERTKRRAQSRNRSHTR